MCVCVELLQDIVKLRQLLQGDPLHWSADPQLLSRLTWLVNTLLNEEAWPRKELMLIVKAKIFPIK